MYLSALRCILLFAIISTSSSVYLDITDELPLYLSDDILISKISRRSLTTNDEPVSTESEKPDAGHVSSETDTTKTARNEDGVRSKRSTQEKKIPESLNAAESNIVFLPSFRRKGFRRFRRNTEGNTQSTIASTEKQETTEKSSTTTEASIKNAEDRTGKPPTRESEDAQESSLVFLPSFGRRSRRSIAKRETSSSEKEKTQNSKPKIESKETNGETEQEEESGLVFLPSFGRRSRRDTSQNSPNKEKQNGQTERNEELENAQESGLVFLPSFGRRSRRYLTKRDIPSEKRKDENPIPKLDNKESNYETEDVEESGLVFRPSFGRRSRRDTSSQNEKSPKPETINPASIKDDSTKFESQNGEESGLVFLPSFGRRNRRHVEKRDTSKNNDQENKSTVERYSDESNEETEEEQESGLVFIPSFGRRTRRDTNEHETKLKENPKTESVTTGKAGTNTGKKTGKEGESEDIQESSLVFLPSFGKRNRREVSESRLTSNGLAQKHDPKENKPLEEDMDESENGMVFLASFGKKH